MALQRKYSWQTLAFGALLFLGLGAFFILTDPRAGITPEAALLERGGKLAWTQENRHGIRFGLVGITEQFEYREKAGEMPAVRDSLSHLGDEVVKIRYESSPKMYLDEAYHNVWGLTVGGRGVRTYAETAAAWEKDNRIGRWFGLVLILCGLFMGYVSRDTYRAKHSVPGK